MKVSITFFCPGSHALVLPSLDLGLLGRRTFELARQVGPVLEVVLQVLLHLLLLCKKKWGQEIPEKRGQKSCSLKWSCKVAGSIP